MTFFSRLFGSNDRESLGSDAGSFRRAEGAAARLEQRIANVEMALAETQDKVYRWMKRHQERQSVNGEDKGAVQNEIPIVAPVPDRIRKVMERRARRETTDEIQP